MATNAWRSPKVHRQRSAVEPLVWRFEKDLADLNPGLEFHLAGSWRRNAPSIGDLDVLVVTESGTMAADLVNPGVELPDFVTWQRRGEKVAQGETPHEDGAAFHFDLWTCRPNE